VQHLRIICPPTDTDEICAMLEEHCGVTNVVVLSGAAREPAGDVVMCDIAREAVNDVLDRLDALGVDHTGSIAMQRVDLSVSEGADNAEEAAPGEGDDAVVWEELAQRVDQSSRFTWSYAAFLAVAVQIAAIGVVQDSPILIVGAMVLGPEFGPIAAISLWSLHGEFRRIGVAASTLVLGFLLAIAVTCVCAYVSYRWGWIDPSLLDGTGRETQFIVKPDKWSFIVALLAGVAGILSVTSDKSSSLVGVFISVTTVPAAAYIALAAALSHWSEVTPSAIQLGVNIAGMVTAGIATLVAQRIIFGRAGLRDRLSR
jgi:uncharacterized hydrophobic protein (TIGR00271 family)